MPPELAKALPRFITCTCGGAMIKTRWRGRTHYKCPQCKGILLISGGLPLWPSRQERWRSVKQRIHFMRQFTEGNAVPSALQDILRGHHNEPLEDEYMPKIYRHSFDGDKQHSQTYKPFGGGII